MGNRERRTQDLENLEPRSQQLEPVTCNLEIRKETTARFSRLQFKTNSKTFLEIKSKVYFQLLVFCIPIFLKSSLRHLSRVKDQNASDTKQDGNGNCRLKYNKYLGEGLNTHVERQTYIRNKNRGFQITSTLVDLCIVTGCGKHVVFVFLFSV